MDTTIEFCIFELNVVLNFTLKKQFWIFGQNLPRKCFSDLKQKKWKLPSNSAYIQISLATKFQLKLTGLIFLTKFSQKSYFRSKSEKLNMTMEFCILELVKVPNFSLNCQFEILDQIFLFFCLPVKAKGCAGDEVVT